MDIKRFGKTVKKDSHKVTSFIEERPIESTIIALAIGYALGSFITSLKNLFK